MSNNIGQAYVQIVPSADGIGGKVAQLLNGGDPGKTAGGLIGGNLVKAIGGVIAAAGIGKFIASSITTGMNFDSAISNVSATMGAAAQETVNYAGEQVTAIDAIRDKAEELGRTTAFSASQAADGFNVLAMAGYSAEDAISTLPGVLDLAMAGGLDIAQAADYATGVIAGFSNETLTASDVGDVLATMASSAKGDVASFGEGLSTVAGMATTTGQKMTDMSVALGILGNNNVSASEAGNALSRVLKNLYQPTDKAKEALTGLGISAYDLKTGAARELPDVLQDINAKMAGMTDMQKNAKLAEIFDSATLKTVPALLKGVQAGADGAASSWDGLAEAVANSEGAAATMAATMQDNLQGSVNGFKSALEGFQIAISEGMMPIAGGFLNFGTSALQQLTEGIKSGGAEGFGEALGNVVAQGVTGLVTAVPQFLNMGTQVISGFIQGIANSAPTIMTALSGVVSQLPTAFSTGLPALMSSGTEVISNVAQGIAAALPQILSTGAEIIGSLLNGIATSIPMLITTAATIIPQITGPLLAGAPQFLAQGVNFIINLVSGLVSAIPSVLSAILQIIAQMIAAFASAMPQLIQTGFQLLGKVIAGIINAIPQIPAAIGQVTKSIKEIFGKFDWAKIGADILTGIKDGILGAVDSVVSAAKGAGEAIFNGIKGFFQIGSPSKLMADEIGKWIPEGIAVGITSHITPVNEAITGAMTAMQSGLQRGLSSINPVIYANGADREREPVPVEVTCVMEGDMQGLFRQVRSYNTQRTRATGYNALAARS